MLDSLGLAEYPKNCMNLPGKPLSGFPEALVYTIAYIQGTSRQGSIWKPL
jgi:hypothetical protein